MIAVIIIFKSDNGISTFQARVWSWSSLNRGKDHLTATRINASVNVFQIKANGP